MGTTMFGNEREFNAGTFNSSLVPGNNGEGFSAAQLRNLGNSDFGWQAGANGGQTGIQSAIYNPVSYDANGVGSKGGLNLDGLGSIMKGIGSVGEMYAALKSIGVAKDNLKFQKESYNTNLGNQTKTYNTNLEDKIASRYAYEGKSSADVDAYVEKHRL
jgi:hypothetical protein